VGRVRRLGVLGGTFDPIHVGHLLMGQTACEELGLDLVVFVPAGVPPHKHKQQREDARARLAMTRAAVAADSRFAVSSVDIDRPAPHYTVDMLDLLSTEYGLEPDAVFFIMGSDSLAQLHTWHRPEVVSQRCILVAIRRPAFDVLPEHVYERVPAARGRLRLVQMPEVGISSTLLRHMVRRGRSIHYWVPVAVEDIIRTQGLYRARLGQTAGQRG